MARSRLPEPPPARSCSTWSCSRSSEASMQRVLSNVPGRAASYAALLGLMTAAGCAPSAPAQAPSEPSAQQPGQPSEQQPSVQQPATAAEAAPAEAAAPAGGDDGLDADIAEL